MAHGGRGAPAGEAGGAGGGPAKELPAGSPSGKWGRRSGSGVVDFGRRRLAVLADADFTRIQVEEGRIKAMKGPVGATVHARMRGDGGVEVLSASLDCMCRSGQVGAPRRR